MVPWLHFSGGDNLLFQSWHPVSKGAIAGASIGLFLFAIFERWLAAMRGVMEARWRRNALALVSRPEEPPLLSASSSETSQKIVDGENSSPEAKDASLPSKARNPQRTFAPFIPAHDLSRGALHAVQALLGYTLMLSVMTFQAAYIISVIAGLGLGEMLFGRLGSAYSHGNH